MDGRPGTLGPGTADAPADAPIGATGRVWAYGMLLLSKSMKLHAEGHGANLAWRGVPTPNLASQPASTERATVLAPSQAMLPTRTGGCAQPKVRGRYCERSAQLLM